MTDEEILNLAKKAKSEGFKIVQNTWGIPSFPGGCVLAAVSVALGHDDRNFFRLSDLIGRSRSWMVGVQSGFDVAEPRVPRETDACDYGTGWNFGIRAYNELLGEKKGAD